MTPISKTTPYLDFWKLVRFDSNSVWWFGSQYSTVISVDITLNTKCYFVGFYQIGNEINVFIGRFQKFFTSIDTAWIIFINNSLFYETFSSWRIWMFTNIVIDFFNNFIAARRTTWTVHIIDLTTFHKFGINYLIFCVLGEFTNLCFFNCRRTWVFDWYLVINKTIWILTYFNIF